jgi:hypothetical protein
LKFALAGFFLAVGRLVRMIDGRQLAIGALDVGQGRAGVHFEQLVIVLRAAAEAVAAVEVAVAAVEAVEAVAAAAAASIDVNRWRAASTSATITFLDSI